MWIRSTVLASLLASTARASSSFFYDGPIWPKNVTSRELQQISERKLLDKIPSLIDIATERFLQLIGDTSGAPSYEVCVDPGFAIELDENLMKIMMTIVNYEGVMESLQQYQDDVLSIGSITALIPEANDAGAVDDVTITDGESGDTRFPHGNLKPVATAGERSVCSASYGEKIVGVPDGLGAYLADDEVVRLVVQSEGYGPLRYESYPVSVNGGKAKIAGSHIQYVDYLREEFSSFMSSEVPASSMVTGMGEMVERMYNLKGEEVGLRNGKSATATGAHYSNTDEDGVYVVKHIPAESDWLLQSLCSAHLEQKHQWGPGLGMEDDIFITNEEWMWYALGKNFVGLSAHVLDISTKSLYAIGSLTNGGFEKSAELNPTNESYIILGVSGYNGPFDDDKHIPGEVLIPEIVLEARNAEYGPRPDGTNYTWSKDIVPYRIYVGVKGKLEDGSDAPADDFLARNGFKYGQLYGFAIDMRNETDVVGPTAGVWRDEWHKTAQNGDMIPGKWIAQPWRWDGQVRNFQHDGSWDYQLPPPGTEPGSELEGHFWWNAGGDSEKGCKTEHLSPDPRAGNTAFIQGSTCGYFGHLYVNDVSEVLAAANGDLPSVFDGTYYVYQGETDVTAQIELGGAGKFTDGPNGNARDATRNWDKDGVAGNSTGKLTFEDIDGLEVFEHEGTLYVMIQEDSSSILGDRMFISSPLEHEADGNDLTYYFVAMSGGKENTRALAGASVPAGVLCFDGEKYVADAHEFSGLFDLSGLLRKDANGNFVMSASDEGTAKRANDAAVPINEKNILVGLQAGNYNCGVIQAFQGDRGGQWLIYQPNIPV